MLDRGATTVQFYLTVEPLSNPNVWLLEKWMKVESIHRSAIAFVKDHEDYYRRRLADVPSDAHTTFMKLCEEVLAGDVKAQ